MKKKVIMKSLVILILLFISSLYFGASYFVTGYSYCADWWKCSQEHKTTVHNIEKMQKYYDDLPVPRLSRKEVISQMIKQKGLLNENEELVKMVEYYVYHDDKQVIRQLVANLPYEVELSLPEETEKGNSVYTRDVIGKSYFILQNHWERFRKPNDPPGVLKAVAPVLHEELHKHSTSQADPHMVYLITELISNNEPYIEKLLSIHNNHSTYTGEGGYYANTDWYTKELVRKDVLAYIRIYVNYKDWPTLRDSVVSRLHHYPGDWLDSAIMREVLHLADEKGVEPAYELYFDWHKGKHHSE